MDIDTIYIIIFFIVFSPFYFHIQICKYVINLKKDKSLVCYYFNLYLFVLNYLIAYRLRLLIK